LPAVRKRREAFVVLSVMGAALTLAAAPSHYSGNNVAILWLAGTEVFLIAGIAVKEVVFRRLGLFTGILVGVHIIGVDFRQLIDLRLSGEPFALAPGVLFALCAVMLYGNALAIGSRWKEVFENTLDRRLLATHSYIGAFAAPAAAWALLAKDWTALAFAAIMLVIAVLGGKLGSTHLHVQYGFLGALTLYRALIVNLHTGSPTHVHIVMRLLSLPLLAAAFYLTAKLAALRRENEQRLFRGALATAGTLLFTLLLVYEVPELWQPLAFIAFAVALSEAGRKLGYAALALHAHALTILAFFQALTDDNGATHQWHTLPIRAFAALPVVAGAYWLAWRPAITNPRHLQIARGVYTWGAAGLLTWILSDILRAPWIVVGWMVLGILLVLATRWIRYQQLAWQAHAVALCAFVRAYMINLGVEQQSWKGVSLRLVTTGLVIGGAYVLATIDTKILGTMQAAVRNVHTWTAAFFLGYLIWLEAPQPWIAVGFLVAGILLAVAGRRWNLAHLSYQEHLFAVAAVYRALTFNYDLQTAYGHFSVRLITISLVAAGLYGISRIAAPREAIYARPAAYLHTTAATGMLALLMWHEASTGWLAALWAVFALVLAALDRRFHLEDLRWQAHALAAITLLRSVGINLHTAETWRGLSVRLLSLSIVAVVFYAMSRLIRMPEEWRARDFHHIYSWAASTLVSLLLWYELQPLSAALGWGVFGLVLFEYGLLRKTAQFRYQAYLALVAAFTRIFFANLTAGEPGQFWSPRMTTILPLALIFFFVYAQLPEKEEDVARDRRFHFDALLAYLGTATVAALFYFQVRDEWVVTSYAALAFALFGAALLLERQIFLHQGILLTLGTLARGMAHNLFGGGYFGEGDWKGRYFVLGSAATILLASLFFAFLLRERNKSLPAASGWKRMGMALVRRPEQLQFFIPFVLLTLMLWMKMRAGMVTVSWGIEGVLIVLLALALKERSFRLTGLGMLLLCVAKVMAMDAWGLQPRDRYITFIIVGAALLSVSFLYSKYRETIRQFL